MKKISAFLALAALLVAQGADAQTLKSVKDRGILNCGANGTLAGFGLPDAQGKWTGLDVDFCRAVAAAVFGDFAMGRYTFRRKRRENRCGAIYRGNGAKRQPLDLATRSFCDWGRGEGPWGNGLESRWCSPAGARPTGGIAGHPPRYAVTEFVPEGP